MLFELKRFISVVEEGSVTKAARTLFITQPALSQSIQRLEKEVGVKLFKRFGKRLVLTSDGEAIFSMAKQITKLWVNMKDATKRSSMKIPIYSIGLLDNAALKLAPFFKRHFRKQNAQFEITIDRSGVLLQGIQQGLFDVCICVIRPKLKIEKEIQIIKIFLEQLYPVSGKQWGKDVKNIPFILYNKDSETRHNIDKVFLAHGIAPNTIVESTSPSFMKELAISGSGVALLPENFIKREIHQKKLFIQKLPFRFQREIGLFLNKESNIKESDEVVKEIIKNLQKV